MTRDSENKIEVYKLKDRFGTPRDRKIFHWDGAKTLFADMNGVQTSLGLDEYEGANL